MESEKIGACQDPAQTAWCFFGVLIPETSGHGWQHGGKIGEDVSGQKCQFGQTLTALLVKDEMTMQTDHLFGSQGHLFHWPAVEIEGKDRFWLQGHVGGRQQGV